MVKRYGYKIPIFDRALNVYIGTSIQEAAARIEKDYEISMEVHATTDGFSTYITNEKLKSIHYVIALETSTVTSRHIAHEALHSAFDMLDYIDVKVDVDNQEALAYLMDYIIGLIEESLKKFKNTKRNGSKSKNNKKLR